MKKDIHVVVHRILIDLTNENAFGIRFAQSDQHFFGSRFATQGSAETARDIILSTWCNNGCPVKDCTKAQIRTTSWGNIVVEARQKWRLNKASKAKCMEKYFSKL